MAELSIVSPELMSPGLSLVSPELVRNTPLMLVFIDAAGMNHESFSQRLQQSIDDFDARAITTV